LSKRGKLVVISGPSGVGKSTLIARLVKCADCRLAVSATTRPPRSGEVEGVHYRFLGRSDFEALRDRGLLLESAEVHGNLYGTPADEVVPWLERGWTVILDVDSQGYRAVRKQLPALGIFVMPPSLADLQTRLSGRGTESEEKKKRRLAAADAEVAAARDYDHVVVNDDVDRALTEVERIIGLRKA
jgi:guanylate kinase